MADKDNQNGQAEYAVVECTQSAEAGRRRGIEEAADAILEENLEAFLELAK